VVHPSGGSARATNRGRSRWTGPPTGWIYYIREPSDSVPHWELRRHNIVADKNELVPTGSGNVSDARLSPDGRWLAWESDESGRHEIYLGPATGTTATIRVSKAGGGAPRWRRDGKELFFLGGDGRIISVSVSLGTAPVLGEPKRVADLVIHPDPLGTDPFLDTRFEPTPAGDRFLIQSPSARERIVSR
jgi:dipeptidyl aminopeptidase/acylaminoacyl peptidase